MYNIFTFKLGIQQHTIDFKYYIYKLFYHFIEFIVNNIYNYYKKLNIHYYLSFNNNNLN